MQHISHYFLTGILVNTETGNQRKNIRRNGVQNKDKTKTMFYL